MIRIIKAAPPPTAPPTIAPIGCLDPVLLVVAGAVDVDIRVESRSEEANVTEAIGELVANAPWPERITTVGEGYQIDT